MYRGGLKLCGYDFRLAIPVPPTLSVDATLSRAPGSDPRLRSMHPQKRARHRSYPLLCGCCALPAIHVADIVDQPFKGSDRSDKIKVCDFCRIVHYLRAVGDDRCRMFLQGSERLQQGAIVKHDSPMVME